MIANNIDGTSNSSGTNQVLDLLSMLAGNPKVYENKLKELQDATEKHKQYVDAVGPASEIVRIRTEITEDQKAAKDAVTVANAKAKTIVMDAQSKADSAIKDANANAARINAEADALKVSSKETLAKAESLRLSAGLAQQKANAEIAAAQEKIKGLESAIAEAVAAKADAQKIKSDIIAKHQKFIDSL